MKYDRIFERNKLESSVDFLKNRSGSHSDRFFSGNILCPKDHEAEAGEPEQYWTGSLLFRWYFLLQWLDFFCC